MSPNSVAERLLEADRAFGSGAENDLVSGLAAMFAADVIFPAPDGTFAEGRDAAIAVLRADPDNARTFVAWAPLRAGVSADGQHGFTFGYMTLKRPDGAAAHAKYLAYWVKSADGWRVAAYRRRPAPASAASAAVGLALPPSLPSRTDLHRSDSTAIAEHMRSLAAAEGAFSDAAQRIGLTAAFQQFGRGDAVNMGDPESGFIFGADAIGRAVGAGTPENSSPVVWNADKVLVAGSGDLGITFGYVRLHEPPAGSRGAFPFFTIWKRDGPSGAWKYIAE